MHWFLSTSTSSIHVLLETWVSAVEFLLLVVTLHQRLVWEATAAAALRRSTTFINELALVFFSTTHFLLSCARIILIGCGCGVAAEGIATVMLCSCTISILLFFLEMVKVLKCLMQLCLQVLDLLLKASVVQLSLLVETLCYLQLILKIFIDSHETSLVILNINKDVLVFLAWNFVQVLVRIGMRYFTRWFVMVTQLVLLKYELLFHFEICYLSNFILRIHFFHLTSLIVNFLAK